MSTIIKMSLKTFQECVRQQTFNRSGYNQIQLDVQYLRGTLRDKMIDEVVIDSLLDEVSDVPINLHSCVVKHVSCLSFWEVSTLSSEIDCH